MIDVGAHIREAREEQGISFAEAEAGTHIKARYLKALETNDWAALPTRVQARGFLRNYAIFLGVDEDEVLSLFSQATRSAGASLPSPPAKDSPVRTTNQDGAVFRPRNIDIERVTVLPSWITSDVLIGLALAFAVAVVGFIVLREVGESSGSAPPAGTPAGTNDAPQVTAEAGAPSTQATLAPATPTFNAIVDSVELTLTATEHVWVRVTVDGTPVLEGILAPETVQSWQGAQQILLETPNAAGLEVEVNGQPQGPLGERGQAVILAWGPNGVISITPTVVP
jgi:cytoskeletal protein RodZ